MKLKGIKEGDELSILGPYRVERITTVIRVLKQYLIDSNGVKWNLDTALMRGNLGWDKHRAVPVTQAHRDTMTRLGLLEKLSHVRWHAQPDSVLHIIDAALQAEEDLKAKPERSCVAGNPACLEPATC